MEPVLIGAGIGALGSALTGKNPFTGAAIGGVTGGIGGGIKNMIDAGTALQGASAITPAMQATQSGFEATMGLPSAAMIEAGAPLASAFPTGANMGLVFNPLTGNYVNPEYYALTGTPLQTFKGGQGLLSNATSGIMDTLPDYVTPKNAIGLANVLAQQQPVTPQTIQASGGQSKPGSVQGLTVNYGMANPIKRRGRA